MLKKVAALFGLLVLISGSLLFAGGVQEPEPTQIDMPRQPRQYISPGFEDGVQDTLVLPFQEVATPGTNLVIVEYKISIFDSNGNVVFSKSDRETARRGFFGDLFGTEKPKVELPDSLVWDGTYFESAEGSDGELVPDGDYLYQITIIDDKGNRAETPPFGVTVDNTPPRIDPFPQPPYLIFSPVEESVRPDVTIPQSGSREYKWTGAVIDSSGNEVFTREWENSTPSDRTQDIEPPDFTWDGKTNTGALAAEGEYTYELHGFDRAGNENKLRLENKIVLNMTAGEIVLDLEDQPNVFSPNNDGVQDVLTFYTSVMEPEGITDWRLEITRASRTDQPLRVITGLTEIQETILFDGMDDTDSILSDGSYQAVLFVEYRNGNRVESDPLLFGIDTEPPRGTISVQTGPEKTDPGSLVIFGGKSKDTVSITINAQPDVEWFGVVSTNKGVLYRESLRDLRIRSFPFTFDWEGTDLLGNELPDGTYRAYIEATDRAGNRGESATIRVTKDTRIPELDLRIDGTYVSALPDSENNSIPIFIEIEPQEYIEEMHLEIINDEDRVVRSRYVRTPLQYFDWYGRNNAGAPVDDGEYSVVLRVLYANGNKPQVEKPGSIIVDSTRPHIMRLKTETRVFGPGVEEKPETALIIQTTSEETEWRGEITDSSGQTVFSGVWRGRAEDFTWEGRDDTGDILPDGEYEYTLTSSDKAGNTAARSLVLIIDTTVTPDILTPPAVNIGVTPLPFSPDGDGRNDTLTLNLAAAFNNPIRNWSIKILDPTGSTFKRFSGRSEPEKRIRWNGRSDSGELVQSAETYTAVFTVTDTEGITAEDTASIPIDILVMEEADGRLRIIIPSIQFAPNTADLFDVEREQLDKNLETLRRLADILRSYEGRNILIEGHAAHVYYQEGPLKEREQREALLPLSKNRAEAVRRAMIILGVERDRMSTKGVGGLQPVVPHSDRENVWKNRRVEFILER
jgi:outer membrane protein OmpA-like peptidoglycan-associated protein/flagellar hook assembly protein FlgD